jgi:hypothetical protein
MLMPSPAAVASMLRCPLLAALLLAPVGCGQARAAETRGPAELIGRFQDDYGDHFAIDDSSWTQVPHGRFHIVEWHPDQQYLIAWNDSTNTSDPGRWSRIDWLRLDGMPPYSWGFCLTAYQAPSRDSARATTPADRTTPMSGCGGHPFSRMRRDSAP